MVPVGPDTRIEVVGNIHVSTDRLRNRLAGLSAAGPAKTSIRLEVDAGELQADTAESYILEISNLEISIRSPSRDGVLRGSQTLLQLIDCSVERGPDQTTAPACTLPAVRIEDQPRFRWRGLLLDVSRHFFTVEEVKKLLNRMAALKLNVLHWHLTDDQGWRIEIRSRPALTSIGATRRESPIRGNPDEQDGVPYGPFFYSHKDVRDVIRHADELGILIVPEIDLPGHVAAALACYPELGCSGGPYEVRTSWGIEENVLCLGRTSASEFARDVLAEVSELFPGPFVHIGGDEVPVDQWKNCPHCLSAARTAGVPVATGLRKIFTRQLVEFLQSRGKRAIGWDEILDDDPPPTTAISSWRGTDGGRRAAVLGHDVVMCPHSHCYLDHRATDEPGQTLGAPYAAKLTLEQCYSFEPSDPDFDSEASNRIIGVQGNLWTEYMWTAEDLNTMGFPRALALAEVGWSPKSRRDFQDFQFRLSSLHRD